MRTPWDMELIPFSDAVQGVHTEITDKSLSPFIGAAIDAVLDELAHAIADLVTIYGAPNDQVPIKALPVAEVEHGAFQRAATVLRLSNGVEYQRLFIRRGDFLAAARFIKKSCVGFPIAEETAAALDGAEVGLEVGLAARPTG